MKISLQVMLASALASMTNIALAGNPEKLLWGDTHLHTKLSPDAYILGNLSNGPDEAYRYAKGLPSINAKTRHKIQINTPLDFLVVAEHAEYMGVVSKLFENDPELIKTPAGKAMRELIDNGKQRALFQQFSKSLNTAVPISGLNSKQLRLSVWQKVIDAAERHNEPGKFTSLIGWEWSSLAGGSNLHRVIFMKENAEIAQKYLPFSSFDSNRPEDLWQWLEQTERDTGANFVAIPHNGNVSKGKMFAEVDSLGQPINTQYAKTRMRWEPIYEVSQIKGDSETLAALSPNDEFAEFETYNHPLLPIPGDDSKLPPNRGDYARTALMRGMEIDEKIGVNPFKFGMIGSTDSHVGVPAIEEKNFGGKFSNDSYPEGKTKSSFPGSAPGYAMSASGLSAVWATENTRTAIFDAFQRKEVYGTTGPRISLRFFGGWDFQASDANNIDLASIGYNKGVSMGSDLTAAPLGKSPSFLIHTAKDPLDGNLDRIQVVKGWLDNKGDSHEKVFNVAASGNRSITNNKLALVGNTVNKATASYQNSIGAVQLTTVWIDPEFDPTLRSFYYIRILQIPTPRHSLYSAVALNQPHPEEIPYSIQERAYSSPIWYTP